MIESTLVVLIVTTSVNLLLQLFYHIKSSSCLGMRMETWKPFNQK